MQMGRKDFVFLKESELQEIRPGRRLEGVDKLCCMVETWKWRDGVWK